jgi:hypothetical protein
VAIDLIRASPAKRAKMRNPSLEDFFSRLTARHRSFSSPALRGTCPDAQRHRISEKDTEFDGAEVQMFGRKTIRDTRIAAFAVRFAAKELLHEATDRDPELLLSPLQAAAGVL